MVAHFVTWPTVKFLESDTPAMRLRTLMTGVASVKTSRGGGQRLADRNAANQLVLARITYFYGCDAAAATREVLTSSSEKSVKGEVMDARRKLLLFAFLSIAALLLASETLQASPTKYQFNTTVSEINPNSPGFPPSLSSVAVGDTITGTITFDSATPPAYNPFGGLYANATYYPFSGANFSVTIDGVVFNTWSGTLSAFVWNNDFMGSSLQDGIIFLNVTATGTPVFQLGNLLLNTSAFDSESLPSAATLGPIIFQLGVMGASQYWLKSGSFSATLETGPLASLKLSKATTAGCLSVTGTVTLVTPAPPEGLAVNLTDTLGSVTMPATLTVPAGATAKTFPIKTVPVASGESGIVSATVGGKTVSQPLTVRPTGMLSLALSPTTVVGGKSVNGTAKLECKAGPGPITVELSSNNPAVASPVEASIVVPQGLNSATFDVATSSVLAKNTARISGTANGITKSKTLTATPAATVSPASVKFGAVTVGTTSPTLNAVLYNKGAVSFSVTGISLTGTGASWFAQTNDCPATLAAGASCTISVTFTPLAAASKSAKLTIATSATSTPLSVSLSGTGVLPP